MVIRITASSCNNAVACIITQIDSACLPKKFIPTLDLVFFAMPLYICGGVTALVAYIIRLCKII